MVKAFRELLVRVINDIDAGNTNIDEDDERRIINIIRKGLRKDIPMSKYQAYTYLNLRRAQFDNLIRAGKIPKGKKEPGFNELRWYKKDLIKYLEEKNKEKKHC